MSRRPKDWVRPRKTVNSLQRGNPFFSQLSIDAIWGLKICDDLSSRAFLSYFLILKYEDGINLYSYSNLKLITFQINILIQELFFL